MSSTEPEITYEVIVERQNGTKVVLLEKDEKITISDFKRLANEQFKKKTTKRVFTIRKVDGEPDGNGVIMRYICRDGNFTVILPKGLYHELDRKVDPSQLKPLKIRIEEDEF